MQASSRFIFNSICIFIIISTASCQNSTDPVVDTRLIANAGEDQTTITGSYAVFDPTKSSGDFNWYEWKQDASNPDTVKIYSDSKQPKDEWNIHKIVFTKEGDYKFILIVRSGVTTTNYNGTNASTPDTLIITVNPNTNSRFEDPNLEAAIRAKLNKKVEELDDNTLANLDSLSVAEILPQDPISSLRGIENCKNLIYLLMSSQDISDISSLASLTKLKVLWLDQNRKIIDVTSLAELYDLEELNLDNNLLTDISSLKYLVKLKYLNLQINPIENIEAVKNMKNLERLEFFLASLSDISPIANLNNLKQLWIVNSKIDSISELSSLNNIINLHLAWNQIGDITPLENMVKLEWVALEKNNISDLSALQNLPNLNYVRLWDNQITDIKPLVDNPGVGEGDIVALTGNPLSEKSINELIPALQARGVVVTW